MNWDAIAAIAELLAAVAVICSILFLALQIRRESSATIANTTQMRQTGTRETMIAIAASDHIAPLLARLGVYENNPPTTMLEEDFGLTEEEAIRVQSLFTVYVRQAEANFRMPQTEIEKENNLQVLAAGASHGAMQKWWNLQRQTLSQDFVEAIESRRDA